MDTRAIIERAKAIIDQLAANSEMAYSEETGNTHEDLLVELGELTNELQPAYLGEPNVGSDAPDEHGW